MADVRRAEEAFWLRLNHLGLDSIGSGAPDREPPVVVMVVEKHHEAFLVTDKECRPTVTRMFRRLRQRQAHRAHLSERLGNLMRRKPAHDLQYVLSRRARFDEPSTHTTRRRPMPGITFVQLYKIPTSVGFPVPLAGNPAKKPTLVGNFTTTLPA